jgi:hypothetical protein
MNPAGDKLMASSEDETVYFWELLKQKTTNKSPSGLKAPFFRLA